MSLVPSFELSLAWRVILWRCFVLHSTKSGHQKCPESVFATTFSIPFMYLIQTTFEVKNVESHKSVAPAEI